MDKKQIMKSNKNLITLLAIVACVFVLAFSAKAQKRKNAGKRTKSTVSAAVAATTASEVKAGAEKVSTQIKNLSKFIYNLGDVARVTEDLDREIAAGKASRNAPALNEKNKRAVVTTVKNLRAGLAALEVEFRTKPALKNYVFQIQGISDMTGLAEDQAASGQLTESGKTLLMVVEKLSDTLAALP